MKRKYISYLVLPVMAFALLGVGTASAHGWFGMGSSATPEQMAQAQVSIFQQQANLLGVSVDEVKTAWAQGKSLQAQATEKGITQEQLKQKMQDARKQQIKTQLQALVTQGVITQAQADQRAAFIDQQIQNKQNGRIGRGMGHRMMGFGF